MNARALGIIILLAGVLAAGIAAVAFPAEWRPVAVGIVIGVAGVAGGRRILSEAGVSIRLLGLMLVYGLCVGGLVGMVGASAP